MGGVARVVQQWWRHKHTLGSPGGGAGSEVAEHHQQGLRPVAPPAGIGTSAPPAVRQEKAEERGVAGLTSRTGGLITKSGDL